MKKKEVKKGLIVHYRGMRQNVRIESNDVNWCKSGPGLYHVQDDHSRGVLVQYVDHKGKTTSRSFIAALQSLKLIKTIALPEENITVDVELPENPAPIPPTIESLLKIIESLENRVVDLENRTLVDVTCRECNGSGTDGDYNHPSKCNRCCGSGLVLALSPLEEN